MQELYEVLQEGANDWIDATSKFDRDPSNERFQDDLNCGWRVLTMD
jgi:hypothetical protein